MCFNFHFIVTQPATVPVVRVPGHGEDVKPLIQPYSATAPTYTWGNLDVLELVSLLKQNGIPDLKLETSATGHIIDIVSLF